MTKLGLWNRSKRRLGSCVDRVKLRIAAALIRSTNDSDFSDDDYDSDEYDDDDDYGTIFSRRMPPAPVDGAARNNLLWPSDKRQLKVRFLNGTTQEKDYVKQLVNQHYNSLPLRIKFFFFTDGASGDSDIRVQFNENKSCSYLARDAENYPNKPTLWINRSLTIKSQEERGRRLQRIVLHEFGHALGMEHEHGHPDCRADWNWRVLQAKTGWTAERVQLNYGKHQSPRTRLAPYDKKSIMHYSVEPGDTHNKMQPVAQSWVLSDGDKRFLMALYPLPIASSSSSSSKPTTARPKPAVVTPARKPEVVVAPTPKKPTPKPKPVVAPTRQPQVSPTPSKPAAVTTTSKPIQKPAPTASTSLVTVPTSNVTNNHRQVTGTTGTGTRTTVGTASTAVTSYTRVSNNSVVSYHRQGGGAAASSSSASVVVVSSSSGQNSSSSIVVNCHGPGASVRVVTSDCNMQVSSGHQAGWQPAPVGNSGHVQSCCCCCCSGGNGFYYGGGMVTVPVAPVVVPVMTVVPVVPVVPMVYSGVCYYPGY
ncbi:hypothetical protein QBC41DRAFT_310582 [Cercophora samala]|uniref:Peptidase metallopeptidase domain-containing protein n=1 Tax=Cercophora samala TaxID=330535 RepID=A0AA39ZMA4_9PEZI|nr:hypothetical protein QBC41DRAFT_310582 [Cercophora samala]